MLLFAFSPNELGPRLAKFIIHIGDGKCGSSSIQSSLFDATHSLKRSGIAYFSPHRRSGNFGLITLIANEIRGDYDLQRRFAMQTISALRGQLNDVEFSLISCEGFLFADPAKVISILRMVSPEVERVDVVAYVRDPLGMYLSLVQQKIKGSHLFPRPDRYRRHLDSVLEAWECCPDVDSVTVRLLERERLVGSSVVPDFEQVLRRLTGKSDVLLKDIDENASMSAEQMVVLQEFRAKFFRDQDGKMLAESDRLIQMFAQMNVDGLVGTKPRLTGAAGRLVARQNAEIVARLNDRYGLDIRCQTSELDELAHPSNVWRSIADILAEVDDVHVRLLKLLIPNFNARLREGDVESARKAHRKLRATHPASAQSIMRAVTAYWKAESVTRRRPD